MLCVLYVCLWTNEGGNILFNDNSINVINTHRHRHTHTHTHTHTLEFSFMNCSNLIFASNVCSAVLCLHHVQYLSSAQLVMWCLFYTKHILKSCWKCTHLNLSTKIPNMLWMSFNLLPPVFQAEVCLWALCASGFGSGRPAFSHLSVVSQWTQSIPGLSGFCQHCTLTNSSPI